MSGGSRREREENVSREASPAELEWLKLIDWSQVQDRTQPRDDLPFTRATRG